MMEISKNCLLFLSALLQLRLSSLNLHTNSRSAVAKTSFQCLSSHNLQYTCCFFCKNQFRIYLTFSYFSLFFLR